MVDRERWKKRCKKIMLAVLLLVSAAVLWLAGVTACTIVQPEAIIVTADGENQGWYRQTAQSGQRAEAVRGTGVYWLPSDDIFLLPVSEGCYQQAEAMVIPDQAAWLQAAEYYGLSEAAAAYGAQLLTEAAGQQREATLWVARQDFSAAGSAYRHSVLVMQSQWGLWQDVAHGDDAARLRQTGGCYRSGTQALWSQIKQILAGKRSEQEVMQAERLGALTVHFLEEKRPEGCQLRVRAEESSVYFQLRSVYWQGAEKIEWPGPLTKAMGLRGGWDQGQLIDKLSARDALVTLKHSLPSIPNRWLYARLLVQ